MRGVPGNRHPYRDPISPSNDLGVITMTEHRFSEALGHFERAAGLTPNSPPYCGEPRTTEATLQPSLTTVSRGAFSVAEPVLEAYTQPSTLFEVRGKSLTRILAANKEGTRLSIRLQYRLGKEP